MATAFTLQHPVVTSAIVGMRTSQQLNDLLLTMNTITIPERDYENLKKSIPPKRYEQHRMRP